MNFTILNSFIFFKKYEILIDKQIIKYYNKVYVDERIVAVNTFVLQRLGSGESLRYEKIVNGLSEYKHWMRASWWAGTKVAPREIRP